MYKATLCNLYSKLLNWMGWDRCQHFSSIFNNKETTGENAMLCYMLLGICTCTTSYYETAMFY